MKLKGYRIGVSRCEYHACVLWMLISLWMTCSTTVLPFLSQSLRSGMSESNSSRVGTDGSSKGSWKAGAQFGPSELRGANTVRF